MFDKISWSFLLIARGFQIVHVLRLLHLEVLDLPTELMELIGHVDGCTVEFLDLGHIGQIDLLESARQLLWVSPESLILRLDCKERLPGEAVLSTFSGSASTVRLGCSSRHIFAESAVTLLTHVQHLCVELMNLGLVGCLLRQLHSPL